MKSDSTIKIIKPTAAYAPELCHIMIKSITEVCAKDYGYDKAIINDWTSNKTPENIIKWLDNPLNKGCAAFDVQNDIFVGFSLINLKGEILLNYLLPPYLNLGIGKAMLIELEYIAEAHGLASITAVSTITAMNFYEKNGFINNGEPEYVGDILGDFPLIKYLQS